MKLQKRKSMVHRRLNMAARQLDFNEIIKGPRLEQNFSFEKIVKWIDTNILQLLGKSIMTNSNNIGMSFNFIPSPDFGIQQMRICFTSANFYGVFKMRAKSSQKLGSLSGALITLGSSILKLNSHCEKGARDGIDIWYMRIIRQI